MAVRSSGRVRVEVRPSQIAVQQPTGGDGAASWTGSGRFYSVKLGWQMRGAAAAILGRVVVFHRAGMSVRGSERRRDLIKRRRPGQKTPALHIPY